MTITESIKFNKLKEENETLKKELAEKEQETNSFKQQIDMAHNFNQNLGTEIEELKQQQLYKEDFYKNPYSTGSIDWILVDSSKYDKLSNKDVK
ncbi:hypothetical protein [Spiroplasma endosymbiont of Ammophila pubescens]|uniref:hypothetical protein n=2 Tax=Spiroplasma endosymbiont of Ammophila pubescens TaxID=3066315 RepID=UPI0032B1C2E2